jgi:glucan phosphoethanolaminetransferase (alkaline phosphatase superfamily)
VEKSTLEILLFKNVRRLKRLYYILVAFISTIIFLYVGLAIKMPRRKENNINFLLISIVVLCLVMLLSAIIKILWSEHKGKKLVKEKKPLFDNYEMSEREHVKEYQ